MVCHAAALFPHFALLPCMRTSTILLFLSSKILLPPTSLAIRFQCIRGQPNAAAAAAKMRETETLAHNFVDFAEPSSRYICVSE